MDGVYLGEIKLFPYMFTDRYAVKGWAECKGQLLSIMEHKKLFALLGIRYGGDGRENFALPNLVGKGPISSKTKYYICMSGEYPMRDGGGYGEYISKVGLFSFGFTPSGWMLCDGRELKVSQNQKLYALLGDRYGGDGKKTFALPNLIEEGKQLDSGINYYIYTNASGMFPQRNGESNDMSKSYLGEIDMFALTYVPRGWKACDGEILDIQKNQALYSLLGNRYGGEDNKTFALPDLKDTGKKIKLLYTISMNTGNYPTRSDDKEIADIIYVGEIRLFPYWDIPKDWAECRGQFLRISEYQDLYELIGTRYGGDGKYDFGIPNLEGKGPIQYDTHYCICIKGDCPKKDVENESEYISRIGIFPYSFAPGGWILCDGRELNMMEESTLYLLLGNRYGGDGKKTFALPNLIEEGKHLDVDINYYIYNGQQGIYPKQDGATNDIVSYYNDIGPYYLGEIDMFALTYPPKNWKKCDGAILKEKENKELFTLFGMQFGGVIMDETFALPNLEQISKKTKLLYVMPTDNVKYPPRSKEETKMFKYLGEIRLFPYWFIPEGWAECKGQLLSITDYKILFSCLGTKYGGDGSFTFALPNLEGLEPIPHTRYCIFINVVDGSYPKPDTGLDVVREIYIGEVRLFPFGFAPEGWALCDGRELDIQDHELLYWSIGNRYGGDGEKTFALPNLKKDGLLTNGSLTKVNYYIFISDGIYPTENEYWYRSSDYAGEIVLFATDHIPGYPDSPPYLISSNCDNCDCYPCDGRQFDFHDDYGAGSLFYLFYLLGNQFGGDIRYRTFMLPNLKHLSEEINLFYAIPNWTGYFPKR